ncbi:hypothetical protein SAG0066_00600 [Streptococcus agalactiae CCUG 38383]|nr:hypothetical protein SAG0066_00600 [Streptococcus agalactiae CCUG 38383]
MQIIDYVWKDSEEIPYEKEEELKYLVYKKNELQINDNINVNVKSDSNSLIIEEREIKLHDGKKIQNAKDLSLKFLPYSLSISFLFSIVISLIYAKSD